MVHFHNRRGTRVAVLGNHEFDFGPHIALDRIMESGFPWLGTDVMEAGGRVSGMRYTYDAAKGPGERITEVHVKGEVARKSKVGSPA